MNGDIALQDVAKLFSLMRIVGVCFPAWLQCQKNRLHHVLLCVGNDPFDLIFQFQIVLFKVICLSKDDLLLRSLVKELSDGGPKALQGKTFNEALYKAFEGAGIRLPKYKKMIMSVRHSDQEEAVDIARRFAAVGYQIFATRGTARTLNKNGVKAYEIRKLEQESPNILDLVLGHQIDLIIDIPAQGAERSHDGFIIRRNAIETGVNVLTSLDTANALVTSLENRAKELTLIDIATVKNA